MELRNTGIAAASTRAPSPENPLHPAIEDARMCG
jgi:hypothetical protein